MARALYVTGPVTLGRYLLHDGIVALGRDAAATILVDDPRVSRMHVALHLGAGIEISDLESANGTFVNGTRLVPHRPQPLMLGQPFFIGDSALVVHSTVLPRSCAKRITASARSAERLGPIGGGDRQPKMLVLDIRAAAKAPADVRVDPERVARRAARLADVGGSGSGAGRPRGGRRPAREPHRARRRGGAPDWGRRAVEVSSRFVSRGRNSTRPATDFGALIDSRRPVTLERGTVVLRDPAMTALAKP